jgi:quercetin dioxygenase-like cupin family protein
MAEKWHVGNANTDGESTRGWLLGHFIGEGDDPRATTAVEVKWGVHPAGEGRGGWATDEQRTTLLILVRGRFRLDLSVASTTLEKEGDYAVWGPGIDHSWQAEEDSIVITVRWPSIPPS